MSRSMVIRKPLRRSKARKTSAISRTYHHGNLRAALVSAAIKIVDKRGPDGLTIRLVAREAGVSHNAPYHHFRDKGAILEAATVSCITAMIDTIRHQQHKTRGNSLDKLVAMGVEFVRFAIEHPAEFRLMHRPELRKSRDGCCGGTPTSPVEAASANGRMLLLETIRQGQKAGEIRSGDPDTLVLAWWCLVNGYANKVLNFSHVRPCAGECEPLEIAGAIVQTLVAGISA